MSPVYQSMNSLFLWKAHVNHFWGFKVLDFSNRPIPNTWSSQSNVWRNQARGLKENHSWDCLFWGAKYIHLEGQCFRIVLCGFQFCCQVSDFSCIHDRMQSILSFVKDRCRNHHCAVIPAQFKRGTIVWDVAPINPGGYFNTVFGSYTANLYGY